MVDSAGIKGTASTDDAVDLISFFKEKFGEITAVLAGYAGDECFFHLKPFNYELHRDFLTTPIRSYLPTGQANYANFTNYFFLIPTFKLFFSVISEISSLIICH